MAPDSGQSFGVDPERSVIPENSAQDRGSRRAYGGMAGHVLRMCSSHSQPWRPVQIGIRCRISVQIGVCDGGDWTPELIVVLGIPAGDRSIGHREVEKCENSSFPYKTQLRMPADKLCRQRDSNIPVCYPRMVKTFESR